MNISYNKVLKKLYIQLEFYTIYVYFVASTNYCKNLNQNLSF